MTARLRKILSCAFAVLAAAFALPAASQDALSFRHGVALFHPLISASLQPGSKTQFVFPAFADPWHRLTEAQLAAIRGAGFDFVRLPVDPGPFLQFKGAQRDALDDVLRQRVQMILDSGLAVIVDFHPIPQSVQYAPKLLVQGVDTPLFQAYCEMLSRTARLLDTFHTNRVALELMNEPAQGWSRVGFAAYQSMAVSLYQAARQHAPHLALILSGGNGGNPQGLLGLDPTPFAKDPALIFTFHYYYPYEFTMQSGGGDSPRNVLFDIPYPASARPMSDSLSALSAQMNKAHLSLAQQATDITRATALLAAYRVSGFDRTSIHAAFDQVQDWARTHGIPAGRIFVGEFGAIRQHGIYHGARDNERAAWLHDVRSEAEEHGFFWSLWAYSGSGGMEITDGPDWTNVDPVTLGALGLR